MDMVFFEQAAFGMYVPIMIRTSARARSRREGFEDSTVPALQHPLRIVGREWSETFAPVASVELGLNQYASTPPLTHTLTLESPTRREQRLKECTSKSKSK